MATGTYEDNETSVIHRMRGAIGDRGVENPETEVIEFLMSDEAYQARLDQYGDWRLAAASIADTLYREFSERPDSIAESGENSISWRTRADGFRNIAQSLRKAYNEDQQGQDRGFRSRPMVRADRERSPYEYRRGGYRGPWLDD